MGKIRLLTDEVASQVAAGEVVERPASIVKELVENSIDAGARRITVEFARGGCQLIRVTDDGSGMDREDAILCLERHATSKIRSAEDLSLVSTMGFRGEALPSIASVSRFNLSTRTREGGTGTEIKMAGGKMESVSDSGVAPGTEIEVSSLFFNVPARKKFLRGEETESAHVIYQMQALAVAHPEVTMSLLRDGRCLWKAGGTSDHGVRVVDLFGADFMRRLTVLEPTEESGIKLEGYLSKPGEGRPDRDQQFVVLNRRVVQCPAVFRALREAYGDALPRGRHPLGVLRISMDPLAFDCNVHPAKREVRLHRPEILKQAVYLSVRRMLENLNSSNRTPVVDCPARAPEIPRVESSATDVVTRSSRSFASAPQMEFPVPDLNISENTEEPFRIIGPLGRHWIILEGKDGLVLLDVRAASERILFENLRKEAASGKAASQNLLLPSIVDLTPKDAVWISENIQALEAAGFHLEPFGGDSFKVESIPACLASSDVRDALLEVCLTLRATGLVGSSPPVLDALIRSVSRFASSNGFQYGESSARHLVRELLKCELPYACPQGRPTLIQWSFSELERKFGR